MIDCMWQAWYDRMARADPPPLHVAAEVVSDEPLPGLRLIRDTGCSCPPGVMCLTLEPGGGERREPGEHAVSWTGWPRERISQVRIDGIAAATVDVHDAP